MAFSSFVVLESEQLARQQITKADTNEMRIEKKRHTGISLLKGVLLAELKKPHRFGGAFHFLSNQVTAA